MLNRKVRVAVNGYVVIGKRIACAVALRDDMELVGVADIVSDWRIKLARSPASCRLADWKFLFA